MHKIACPILIPCHSLRRLLLLWMRLGLWFSILVLPTQSFGEAGQAPWIGLTFNKINCKGKEQGYGPFDYLHRKQFSSELTLVEEHHFTPKVEALDTGQEGWLIDDIDYTLRAWPNHHRALSALIRYKNQKTGSWRDNPPVECYLQRAIHFSPDDVTPRLLYAIHLHKLGYKEKALEQYRNAETLSPNNPELNYNLGLLLVGMKQFEEAKIHALKAYQAGYPLPGLKQQLTKLGYWNNK